ncbi:CDP-glucose 4,6-dehydratase [Pelagibacteraceae bacterium]|nr:CDP-glucose 4,6-dehydratase [Pelagibacteraceae bacterium]
MDYKKFFKNKKVIVTGHTGFKGSWTALWLHSLGAKVIGISKDESSYPSHFKSLKLRKKIKSIKLDIRNLKSLKKVIKKNEPDFLFHLAAQALVKKSYIDPIETWNTNCIGTINILESLRNLKKKTYVVIITSDKSYKNIETKKGYQEEDSLGGIDPYGASKSSAEIAIKSYVKSFFSSKKNNVFISVARAGNVIGGGDWSADRLVPDCVKSWSKRKKVFIRSPNSTRPWQHVLEAVNGYLILAINLKLNNRLHGHAFNFGPKNKKNYKVINVVKEMKKSWNLVSYKIKKEKFFFENKLLNLNSSKANRLLKWKCVLDFRDTIFLTIDWYKSFYEGKINKSQKSLNQIKHFMGLVKKRIVK